MTMSAPPTKTRIDIVSDVVCPRRPGQPKPASIESPPTCSNL
jgi:hypothetical protein